MPKFKITRTDNSVIARGEAKNIAAFIMQLAADKVDLSHLNARNLELTSLKLPPGTCLRGANWNGATLNQMIANEVDFTNGSWIGTRMSAVQAHRSDFSGGIFKNTNFRNAHADRIKLFGCSFEDCNLSGWYAPGANFDEAYLNRCSLAHSEIPGSSHIRSKYYRCDFSDTNFMSAREFKRSSPLTRMKPYWFEADVGNCLYTTKTQLPVFADAAKRDRQIFNLKRVGVTFLTGLTLASLTHFGLDKLHEVALESSSPFVIIGIVLVTPLIEQLADQYIGEEAKDKVREIVDRGQEVLRGIRKFFRKAADLGILTARSRSSLSIATAHEASYRSSANEKATWPGILGNLFRGEHEVVMSDQLKIASSLSNVKEFIQETFSPPGKMTFIRPFKPRGMAGAVTISNDGTLRAVFRKIGGSSFFEFHRGSKILDIKIHTDGKPDRNYSVSLRSVAEFNDILGSLMVSGHDADRAEYLFKYAVDTGIEPARIAEEKADQRTGYIHSLIDEIRIEDVDSRHEEPETEKMERRATPIKGQPSPQPQYKSPHSP